MKVRIVVCVEAFLVFDLIGELVISDHVEGEEVDDSLLPSDRFVRIDESDTIQSIVLYFSHGTSMCHKPFTGDVS